MSRSNHPGFERLPQRLSLRESELLADDVACALAPDDLVEFRAVVRQHPSAAEATLRAAALAQLAFLRREQQQPGRSVAGDRVPSALRQKIVEQGQAYLGGESPVRAIASDPSARRPESATRPASTLPPRSPTASPSTSTGRRRWSPMAVSGWALAATLAIAFVVVRNEPASQPGQDATTAPLSLVRNASDVQTLAWSAPTAAGYEGVTGEVVWSPSLQQGFLRLANMPINDPTRSQYQLWIVDPERDTHPVDGGVFNIATSGEVVVPIQAKLRVVSPRAFAITAEQPGGVVVSAGPLLVVAST